MSSATEHERRKYSCRVRGHDLERREGEGAQPPEMGYPNLLVCKRCGYWTEVP